MAAPQTNTEIVHVFHPATAPSCAVSSSNDPSPSAGAAPCSDAAAPSFAAFEADFLRFTSEIVWCSVATVGRTTRPRSRILHPIWEVLDGCPVGWILTRRTPIKTAHLAHSPYVACTYWRTTHDTVLVDGLASWDDDPAHKQRVWDWFASTPPPLGYDPRSISPLGTSDPNLALLKLDPWRVQIVTVQTLTDRQPRVWHRAAQT